ncbi:MAG: ATP-binding protein [Spirochaetes bacterium]|uniref:ATP-binding protein n=1 Tax=Candidatus Aphodenecus pullistercoris TaxID=2840669 RepID=A0A9D9E8S1_9SPIR|nr:ATP-binding protein [Candidatus Aphodenecus pullistercoris]
MLVKFTFKNVRSFIQEQCLNLVASGDDMMGENIAPVSKELLPQSAGVLKTAAIFGAMASGKTNVLCALDYMKRVVLISASHVRIVRQCETNAFIEGSQDLDSHYEVEFIENGRYYRYGFVIRRKEIVKEWLMRRSERLTTLFSRDEYSLKVAGLSKNEARLIAPSPSTLFISMAASLNLDINREVGDVLAWFSRLTVSLEPRREDLLIYTEKEDYLASALRIVRKLPCGIEDAHLIQDGSYVDIETERKVRDKDGNPVKIMHSRLFQDRQLYSDGTVELLCRLALVVKALDQGAVLFVNDFTSMMNTFLSNYILSLFSSGAHNPSCGQLVITAGISSLMDKAFRRDQIFFTTMDGLGGSQLVRLSSIPGVRKGDSYEKKLIENAHVEPLMLD